MKVTCDIVQDMLPLYCDGVCSEESKRAVEEHLQGCETCRKDRELMGSDTHREQSHMTEEQITAAAAAAWKKGKSRAFLTGGLIALLLIVAAVGAYGLVQWMGTATADDLDALAVQAAEYLGYDELVIEQVEQRGNYLAALCIDPSGDWCMCVYDRNRLFEDRWRANGGKKTLKSGDIGSWNYGSPQNEAVLIFCGGELSEEICWYQFQNGGITYTCPVEDDTVLDIFIIPDRNDINGHPILLN